MRMRSLDFRGIVNKAGDSGVTGYTARSRPTPKKTHAREHTDTCFHWGTEAILIPSGGACCFGGILVVSGPLIISHVVSY